jgi:hypothetical protein
VDISGEAALLRGIMSAAAYAAPYEANVMAETFRRQVVDVTLRQSAHAPGEFYKQVEGQPPAYASGALANSVQRIPAFGRRVTATSYVAAYARYAALQEWGGDTWPNNHRFMHWVNTGGSWYMPIVTIPEHPFFQPSLKRIIANGDLQKNVMAAFMSRVGPAEGV